MDYHEFLLALQLLAEERFGVRYREHQRTEDRQFQESMKQQVKHGVRR